MPWEFEAIVAALTSDESKPTCRVFTTRTGTCPSQAKFHKSFYRLLDSNDLDPAIKSELVKAEQGIFFRQVGDCTMHNFCKIPPQVLDGDNWPSNPGEKDQKEADRTVGHTIWSSLSYRYNTDEEWKNMETAPIIMRRKRKAD